MILEHLQPILWILKWANGLYLAAASNPNFVWLSTQLFHHMTHTENTHSSVKVAVDEYLNSVEEHWDIHSEKLCFLAVGTICSASISVCDSWILYSKRCKDNFWVGIVCLNPECTLESLLVLELCLKDFFDTPKLWIWIIIRLYMHEF